MATSYCQNCGKQLQDADIRYCSNCGSKIINPTSPGTINITSPSVVTVKSKLKLPALAIIVNAGISFILCLFFLSLMKDSPSNSSNNTGRLWLAVGNTLYTLLLPVFAFIIYSAVQMMSTKKYGFSIASAIITIFSSVFTGPLPWLGLPIGVWALVVLLKTETKSAFADISLGDKDS